MVNVEYDEYRPEALKFAREEMTRRGLPIEPARAVDENPLDAVESDARAPEFDGPEFDEAKLGLPGEARGAGALPEVRFELFRSTMSSWESLFGEAADFASRIGPDDLINISHSEDSNEGVVTVWYWSR
jgi:hypothetical protein